MERKNVRRHVRTAFDEKVRVSWLESNGRGFAVNGLCLDRSKNGLRVEIDRKIEPRTAVHLHVPGHGALGMATVRYCNPKGLKFVAGLELKGDVRWRTLETPARTPEPLG